MRIVSLAARGAALGLLVASCGTNQTSGGPNSGSTGAGTTSSTSSGAGGAAPGAILDMFCNAVADAACEADYACCTNEMYQWPQWVPNSIDSCKKIIASSIPNASSTPYLFCDPVFGRPDFEAALQAGIVVFDQAQFDTCLALLKSMSAGGTACTQPPMNVAYTTCMSAFRGQIAPGEACPGWSWTNSVVFCKEGSCYNDVCVPFIKTGDACPAPKADPATQCNWVKGEGCHGAPGAGGAGGGDGGVAMGVCAPPGEIGDPCHQSDSVDFTPQCRSHNCDQATGRCVLPDPQSSACDLIY